MREQELARLRERELVRRSMQQLDAELLFEQPDLAAQRGLRDVEPLGGAGEVALPRDCNEVLQPTQIGHPSDPTPARRLANRSTVGRSNARLGVDASDAGVASGTVNASRQVGGSLGIALLSTIAATASAHYLAATRHSPDLIAHAVVHGYAVGFGWAGGIFAVSALVTAVLFRGRANAPDQHERRRHRVRARSAFAELGTLPSLKKLICAETHLGRPARPTPKAAAKSPANSDCGPNLTPIDETL